MDGSNGHLLVAKDLFSHARAIATQDEEMARNGLLLQALAVLFSPKITQEPLSAVNFWCQGVLCQQNASGRFFCVVKFADPADTDSSSQRQGEKKCEAV